MAAAMADVQPLTALRYDIRSVGSLDAVVAPPYDVIDEAMRAALTARSPFNVVEVDLPVAPGGGDPYLHAQTTFEAWRQGGIVVRTASRPSGRRRRTTRRRTASAGCAAASSAACASRTTGPAGSARTSARTPARRRTACG